MKSFRLPRSRRLERAKFLVKSSLRQLIRRLPLPEMARVSLHSWLERLSPLKPRWSDCTKPLQPPDNS